MDIYEELSSLIGQRKEYQEYEKAMTVRIKELRTVISRTKRESKLQLAETQAPNPKCCRINTSKLRWLANRAQNSDFRPSPSEYEKIMCHSEGIIFRDGRWYCGMHDPVAINKRKVKHA